MRGVSWALAILSAILIYKPGLNFGVDFAGGERGGGPDAAEEHVLLPEAAQRARHQPAGVTAFHVEPIEAPRTTRQTRCFT